jgi:PAS domain S-box-containing protein
VQASARELNLVDPTEGTDLLFEVLAHPLPPTIARDGSYLSVLRDVTDLKRASIELERQFQRMRLTEAEATRERDRLNMILNNVGDPILVTDDQSKIILMNPQAERLFELPDGTPADRAQVQRIRGNDTKFTTLISDFAISPALYRREQVSLAQPQTGAELPMEVVSGKIMNERGEPMAIVSVLHDLTKQAENERLYETLKQLNAQLEERVRAAAEVDAAVLAASRPGTTLGACFGVLAREYEAQGYAEEWRRHHQGGLTGYRGREAFATPGNEVTLPERCAVAWNPSVTGGGKSEDTALVTAEGVEVITRTRELGELDTAAGIPRSAVVAL